MSNQTLDVSIVIASWSAASTLGTAVESCLAQQSVTREILIVDDCSTDGSYELALTLAERHPEIRVLKTPKNSGPSAARNIGLREAAGRWIAIMDSDDTMMPSRLADMIGFAEKTRADAVLDNMTVLENGSSYSFVTKNVPEEISLSYYALENLSYRTRAPLGYLKPLLRTGFLRQNSIGYDEKLLNSEDYLLILELLVRKARVRFFPACGYVYHRHDQSISASFDPLKNRAFIDAEKNFKAKYGSVLSADEVKAIDTHLRYRIMSETIFRIIDGAKSGSFGKIFSAIFSARMRDLPVIASHLGLIAAKKITSQKSRFDYEA